jgi:hypothetical protein
MDIVTGTGRAITASPDITMPLMRPTDSVSSPGICSANMTDTGPTDWTRYFAYGSNMSSERLRGRVPRARPQGRARLEGWILRFDEHGRDGTAKASIARRPDACVWGVLHTSPRRQLGALHAAEDLGRGYAARWLEVFHAMQGRALTYVGLLLCEGLSVAPWYLDHCLRGAVEQGLPSDYVAWLRGQAGVSR